MTIPLTQLQELLTGRFHGVLSQGCHPRQTKVCGLELLSVVQGIEWTDSPATLRIFDLRPINDIAVTESVRTQEMLPILSAYSGSLDWPQTHQDLVISRIVIGTVNRLIADLPGLPAVTRRNCQEAHTLYEALMAARGAEVAVRNSWKEDMDMEDGDMWATFTATSAVVLAAEDTGEAKSGWAAKAAASATEASEAPDTVATEKIFRQICAIWMESARTRSHGD